MITLWQDFRYAARVLRRAPAFTAVAAIVLASGIGANSAIFSLFDAVVLQPLPFQHPEEPAKLWENPPGYAYNSVAPLNFLDWSEQNTVFASVAAVSGGSRTLHTAEGGAERIPGQSVSLSFFDLLGIRPVAGRTFGAEDGREDAKVVVLSERLWRDRFGADPKLVGSTIPLDGEPFTVIGIVPARFQIFYKSDLWTPFIPRRSPEQRRMHYLQVLGRLKPGVTFEQARAGMAPIAENIARIAPDINKGWGITVEPLPQALVGRDLRITSLMLAAVAGFVLLMACANIANLLLSRAAGRQRELAVRTALGANRARLVRQLLTESALMAIGGGALGVLLADWCFVFLKNLVPEELSRMVALSMDFRVLAFTVAVSLACSIMFGLAPALQISGIDLNEVLKQGGRGNTGPRRSLFRSLLVIGEVALSLVLLVGSGLMIESFSNMRGLNPGFRADHVLTLRLEVPGTKYGNFASRTEFFQTVLERVRTIPGVKAAGFTSALPLTWKGGTSSFTPEHVVLPKGLPNDANDRVVSPGYFEAMRIPLRKGRFFDEHDGAQAAPVVMINETMARKFWQNQDALGRRMQYHHDGPWFQIIGIVGDVRQMGLNEPPRQEMYFPYWQAEKNWMVPRDLAIRTDGDPMALVASVKRTIASIDHDQPISDIKTMDQWLDEEVSSRHVQTILLGGFAALALVLACIGIYGVLAYVVTQRTPEIGLRVALGADARSVFLAVAKQGMSLAGIGIALGIAASLVLSSVLQSLLFDVKPTDPVTYLAAALVFALVALLACYIPARRAAKVDPLVALRYE